MVDSFSFAQAGYREGRFIDIGVLKVEDSICTPCQAWKVALALIIQIQVVWKGPNNLTCCVPLEIYTLALILARILFF